MGICHERPNIRALVLKKQKKNCVWEWWWSLWCQIRLWSHNWHEQWNVKADWCGECNETGVQGDSHTFFWNAHSSCLTTWHHIISQSTVLPTFTALCISGCMEVGWYSGWCGQKFLVRYSVFHWFEVFESILVFSSELKHYVKKKGQALKCKLQSLTFRCAAVGWNELTKIMQSLVCSQVCKWSYF
jgi:hypothetical protein